MHEKKGIFCRIKSVAMTPKSRDHMPTTSLWGVATKWPTRAPKTNIVQELCESRGGRPGLSVLTSLLVSVDVKNY